MTMVEVLKPDFRVFKIETTKYWSKGIRRRAGKLFAVYIFDVNRHVHCCEMTPSYEMRYVGPTWKFVADDQLFEDVLTGDADTDLVSYYHVNDIDVDKLEKRSISDDDWEKLINYHDGDVESAYNEALEKEIEYLRCNGYIY